MKRVVRNGVFESNSSSTHSLTITTLETYERWERGEILFDRWEKEFVPLQEKREIPEEDVREFYIDNMEDFWKSWEQLTDAEKEIWKNKYEEEELYDDDERLMTVERYDEYYGECYELYEERFTTPSGDQMIAFGHYGYN